MLDTYGIAKTSIPVERIPGEKMYIDWVGDQPELLLDTTTGELRKVHIFTTTLGFSSLVYTEIFPDEKLPHFITGTVHALSYYGTVPKYLVPDNLRTAVTRHSKLKLILLQKKFCGTNRSITCSSQVFFLLPSVIHH